MSAHGISPAWVVNNENSEFKFGEPWLFDPESLKIFFINCSIALEGDVETGHNIGLVCDLETENLDSFHNLNLNCSINLIGDVNPTHSMSIIVVTEAQDP